MRTEQQTTSARVDGKNSQGIVFIRMGCGLTKMIALKAAHFAAHRPGTTVLVVAPSARQSGELLGIAARMLRDLMPDRHLLEGQDYAEESFAHSGVAEPGKDHSRLLGMRMAPARARKAYSRIRIFQRR